MKPVLLFIRTTLTGGILFLLPVVLLIILLQKANAILEKLSGPLAEQFPDRILGFDGSALVTILLILLICFFSGLLFRSILIKKWIGTLEDSVLSNLPGYTLIKSITADAIGENTQEMMHPVLIQDGQAWNIAFLVEENEGLCTVFLPDAPRLDAGEVKIVPAAVVKKLNLSNTKVTKSLRAYGKGAISWVRQGNG